MTPFAGLRRALAVAAGCAALLVTNACQAPGKPGGGEPLATEIADFHDLYATNCAGCHGDGGKNGPARILNAPLYLSFIPKADLKNVLLHGRPGTAMPAWSIAAGGPLTDKQIDILTNGIYDSWARPFDTHGTPLPPYSAALDHADLAHGKKVFSRACFLCHGPGAAVGPVTTASYLALVSNQMLRTSIVVGRPDLGMANYLHLNAGKALADDDITDIVAYLVSLRPAAAEMSSANGDMKDKP